MISSNFDSGNIVVVDASDPSNIQLRLREEPFTQCPTDNRSHKQWFHFKASNLKDVPCTFNIVDAGEASYAQDYTGYWACCSYDRQTWTRAPTEFDGTTLSIKITPTHDAIWLAYFAPYSYERHQDLIASCNQSPFCTGKVIGQTLDGRDLDLLKIGTGPRVVWSIARQHPNEPQGEFWMEGLLRRLLDKDDAIAAHLRAEATFYIVPNMNPDGAIRGHLRTNASGANLNREWSSTGGEEYIAPTLERSPEVYYLLQEVDRTGCDCFLDIHGDEELPYNFIAGPQGVPNYGPRLAHLLNVLCSAYARACPFFQVGHGYDAAEDGAANLAMCTNQIASRFDCLAITLEMPYKDLVEHPDPGNEGWNPKRCDRLGAAMLDALQAVLPLLRAEIDTSAIGDLPAWTQPGYKNPPWEEPTYPFAEQARL